MALNPNALTDYATIAADLGLSGSTDQALIERMINVASAGLERYCARSLVYASGVAELRPMYGGPKLVIDRTPIVAVGDVQIDASSLDATDYSVFDADAGILWRAGGWFWTALLQSGRQVLNFTQDQTPGTEEKRCEVFYAGGYITSPQAYGASAWPGATTAVAIGQLCKPTGHPTQLWYATFTKASTALTGSSEPTWPSSPLPGATITDGAVTWTYLGTAGSAGSPGTAVTLPADLEEACILWAKAEYRQRRDNVNVKSESLLGTSVTYDRQGMPAMVQQLADGYRRLV